MTYNIIAVVLGVVLMLLGDHFLPNQVKSVYEEKGGSWGKVINYSRASSVFLGLVSVALIEITKLPKELNPSILAFAVTVTAYVSTQSIMTDVKTLLINRHMLRLAYVMLFVLALYNSSTNPHFIPFRSGVFVFAIALFLMFLFINVGASDIRAMAVALPFSTAIGGASISIGLLIISLLIAIVVMNVQRRPKMKAKLEEFRERYPEILEDLGEEDFKKASKEVIKEEMRTSKEFAVPVGPFMVVPFLIFLIAYPLIILL